MAGKNKGAIDPVAIRELISQGIPMKKKESEMILPASVEEVDVSVSETRKEVSEESQHPSEHVASIPPKEITSHSSCTAMTCMIARQSTSPESCRTNCRKSSSSSERER